MPPLKSAKELGDESNLIVSNDYSINAWLTKATRFQQEAEMDDIEGRVEAALRGYWRFSGIITTLPKHREYSKFQANGGPKYREFLALKAQLGGPVIEKMRRLKEKYVKLHQVSVSQDAADRINTLSITGVSSISNTKNQLPSPDLSLDGMRSRTSKTQSVLFDESIQDKVNASMTPQQLKSPDVIKADKLFKYAQSSHKVLLLDLRTRQEFLDGHISGFSVVNIDPSMLLLGMLGTELELKLSTLPTAFHRDNFCRRHEYDLVVYMDDSSTRPRETDLLDILMQTIQEFELVKVLQRIPALLQGGWRAWKATTSATPIKAPDGGKFIVFGDMDGIVSGSSGGSSTSSNVTMEYTMPTINRSTSDYVNRQGSIHQTSSVQMPTSHQSSLPYHMPTIVPTAPENRFDSPYYNFATSAHFSDAPVQLNSTSTPSNYYPEHPVRGTSSTVILPPVPLPRKSLTSSPPAVPKKDSSYSYTSSQFAQNVVSVPVSSAPPLPRRTFSEHRVSTLNRIRAPSPTGGSSASLTIHSPSALGDQYLENAMTSSAPSGRGFVGLKNLGNTCFMNSTLQCLMATKPLTGYFYDGSYKKVLNIQNALASRGKLANSFSSLVTTIFREENGVVVSPASFKEVLVEFAPQFRGSDQQDSQEFLSFLLDGLHEDMNQGVGVKGSSRALARAVPEWIKKIPESQDDDTLPESMGAERAWFRYLNKNDSLIVSLFQGQLMSSLECQTCGKTSTTFNPFMYLSVPIPANGRVGSFRLSDCLNEFVKNEVLDEADSWRCPKCKVPRRAVKRLTISRLPKILLVHLKRFSFDGRFRDKIDQFVDFPISGLDMFAYLSPALKKDLLSFYSTDSSSSVPFIRSGSKPPQKYDLYAISNHYGGLNGGHYTAMVRQPGRKAWYHFDDSRVSEICQMGDAQAENARLKTKAAYSLYYVSWSV